MSTTLVKPAEVERKWYLLDAAGKSLGHVAAEAAVLLRGKQKVDYTPNVDCGDFVVVINCDQAVLTGKKAEQKFHITHSKYIGGLKKVQYSKLMAEHSDLAMTYAVKGMIPSNTIGAKALTRLHCYQGAEHAHSAQKPEFLVFYVGGNRNCTKPNIFYTALVVVRIGLPGFVFTPALARSPSTIVISTTTLVWRP